MACATASSSRLSWVLLRDCWTGVSAASPENSVPLSSERRSTFMGSLHVNMPLASARGALWVESERADASRPLMRSRYEYGDELEVVTDPERELRFPEPARPTLQCIDDVFVVLVQQGSPRPIEMHREANEECLQPEAVRRARVDQPEAADRGLGTEHRVLQPRHAIGSRQTNDRRFDARTGLPPRKGLAIEVSAAHAGEEHAADAAEDPERREHRFDKRESQLGIGERSLRTE